MPDFFDVLRRRQSCRGYLPTPVEHEKLVRCMEAVRLSPSACNSQPYSLIAIEDPSLARQVAGALGGMNKFAAGCPCFVVIVEEEANLSARFGAQLKKQDYTSTDIGIACAHLTLAATAQGLSTCILGWFEEDAIKALLDIPRKKRVRLIVCMGYAQDETLREKDRKPLEALVEYR